MAGAKEEEVWDQDDGCGSSTVRVKVEVELARPPSAGAGDKDNVREFGGGTWTHSHVIGRA